MSQIENLENIKKSGIKKFIKNEAARWACQKCDGVVCIHTGQCIDCGAKK